LERAPTETGTPFVAAEEPRPATAKEFSASDEDVVAICQKLKSIALAFHNFHDAHRTFVPWSRSDRALPALSWRVYLLPYLDQEPLYHRIHLDEPWDSPNNIELLKYMPEIYRSGNDNGDQVTMVLDEDGDLSHRYLYGPGTDLLLVDEVFSANGDAERLLWAATDQAGSVHDWINGENGYLVHHIDYDPFGEIAHVYEPDEDAVTPDTIDSAFAFAGREWDNDLGLYYNRARWLDARTGRFLSEDPLGFEGSDTNLYRYAGNCATRSARRPTWCR
jgi:RHS repeat-associated protein